MRCSNLSGLNLEGEISPAVGALKSLVSMYGMPLAVFQLLFFAWPVLRTWCIWACSDLKSNGLTGQIPDEIGDCSSIKTL